MASVKLYLQEEQDLRRIRVDDVNQLTLDEIKTQILSCFPQLEATLEEQVLQYVDDEGDHRKATLQPRGTEHLDPLHRRKSRKQAPRESDEMGLGGFAGRVGIAGNDAIGDGMVLGQ